MYKKVSTDMNFVEREKEVESSGMMNRFSRRVWMKRKDARIIFSMMDLRRLMVSRISDMF